MHAHRHAQRYAYPAVGTFGNPVNGIVRPAGQATEVAATPALIGGALVYSLVGLGITYAVVYFAAKSGTKAARRIR